MLDFHHLARQLLEIADGLRGQMPSGARVFVFADALPDEPMDLGSSVVLITREGEDVERVERLAEETGAALFTVPRVVLDRSGQVNLVTLLAMSHELLCQGDAAVFLVGEQGRVLDTLHVMTVGDPLGLAEIFEDDREKDTKHIRRAVFQRVISIALELAEEGREGKAIGAFFVVGDSRKVAEHTEQLIINPFRGYPEDMRNILDDSLLGTVKEFSAIDGSFVIRGDGVIQSAGTLMRASLVDEDLPKGLGARHAAAAGITKITDSIAVTVSQSDGTVRVWRKGKIITFFERT